MERFPGDPEVVIQQREEYGCRVTSLSMSAHTGTHLDAPLHFLAGAASIDRLPLEVCMGPVKVVDSFDSARGERVLFKGLTSLTAAQAREIVKRGARLVGVESLSVDVRGDGDFPAHHILLEAGVWIVENLDLGAVPPGEYDLICLPLLIPGADGAPARALLRPR